LELGPNEPTPPELVLSVPNGVSNITLQTETLQNPSTDWAFWKRVRVLEGPLAIEPVKSLRSEAVSIFRFKDSSPIANVYYDVKSVKSPEAALQWMVSNSSLNDLGVLEPNFDLSRTGVVEGESLSNGNVKNCKKSIVKESDFRADGEIHIVISSPCAGHLVVSDLYYPGWSARVNNQDMPVQAFNSAFLSVQVPKGSSEVVFTYRPSYMKWVRLLMVVGLLSLVMVSIYRFRLLLKRRTSPVSDIE
jgi:hypothetical protein